MNPRARRLFAAYLVGTTALGVLGQYAVAAPAAYFGGSGETTSWGALFATGMLVLLMANLLALLWNRPWWRVTAILVPSASIATFVPLVVADPALAVIVVLWNVSLLGRLLAPAETGLMTHRPPQGDPAVVAWLETNAPAARHLLLVGLTITVGVLGFERSHELIGWLVCGALDLCALLVVAPYLRRELQLRSRWPVAVLLLIAAAGLSAWNPGVALGLVSCALALTLLRLWSREQAFVDFLNLFYAHPALLVVSSFAVLIGAGTLALCFPAASATSGSLRLVDALFTATSAACVTGLIVLDTPHDFTWFGQAVILLLIQIGGLNIMVLSTFGGLLVGRGLGLRGERALGELLDIQTPESAYRLLGFIVAATVIFEGIGATVLGLGYWSAGYDRLEAVWNGVFHSISAFCNAGFALQSDSLVMFRERPLVLLTVAGLITLGGLGFVVLSGMIQWTRTRGVASLRVHARLVLVASAALVLGSTASYAVLEWSHSLGDLGAFDKLVNSLFQGVTLRTAGFNSVSFDALQPATSLLMMVMMFIGASPGGTGGGIKTTTAVVLLAAVPAILRGRPRIVFFGRTVSLDIVYRSAAIVTVSMLVLAGGTVLLLATQPGSFQSLLFEAFSAVGTVGLSLGATSGLDSFGKIVIMILMFVGRIGPLTFALLLGRRLVHRVEYPQARIIVG